MNTVPENQEVIKALMGNCPPGLGGVYVDEFGGDNSVVKTTFAEESNTRRLVFKGKGL